MSPLSSTLKMEEETINMIKNQGIGSILGSENPEKKCSGSLRRTLSADMSSAKYMVQNKVSSGVDAGHHSEGEEDEEEEEEEMVGVEERPSQFDIWTLITSQNDKQDKSLLPPPYVHPLGKRTSSSLSEKSLEICTESLGSETGSDGFSFESDDDAAEIETEIPQPQPQQEIQQNFTSFEHVEDNIVQIVKSKHTQQRCFPPPIRSLSSGDGASIRMETRRDNGRLVVEAVTVPTTNNFRVQRHDGRLVLTFIPNSDDDNNNFEEEEEDNDQIQTETKSAIGSHRLTVTMNKKHYLRYANNNFNKELDPTSLVSKSLPPPPRMIPKPPSSAVSFNAYEYYWRPKKTEVVINKKNHNHYHYHYHEAKEIVVMRGNKGENYLVPMLKSCKEPRRSLLFLDTPCIATS